MLALIKKLFVMLLAALMAAFPQFGDLIDGKRPTSDDFRVTTYVVAEYVQDESSIHAEDFDIITDVNLFGCARFDSNGNINLEKETMETALKNLRNAIGERDVSISLTLLGPTYNGESTDWYDMMEKQAKLHNRAFTSPNFKNNILNVLNEYGFDGVQFDYEYPITKKNWAFFNGFLASLKDTLGNKTLGIAIADWDIYLDSQAIEAVDYIELMMYDIYDAEGRHATTETCIERSKKVSDKGIPRSKVDFGLPFYARPTDGAALWHSYINYADLINENGFYYDTKRDKLFWFNTPPVIEEKTIYAKEAGYGGVMVWHYTCDFPSSDERSLLRAIKSGELKAQERSSAFENIDFKEIERTLRETISRILDSIKK